MLNLSTYFVVEAGDIYIRVANWADVFKYAKTTTS